MFSISLRRTMQIFTTLALLNTNFPAIFSLTNRNWNRYLDVTTFNTAFGGALVKNGKQKVERVVVNFAFKNLQNWHVIALQEIGKEQTEALVHVLTKATGKQWSSVHHEESAILTDGKIESETFYATGKLQWNVGCYFSFNNGQQKILVWNVHFTPYPYGPYMMCRNNSMEAILTYENVVHVGEVLRVFRHPSVLLLEREIKIPFIFLGDFNSPSHEDKQVPRNPYETEMCKKRNSIQWPFSQQMKVYGFHDAFRETYPADLYPGFTWSPFYKTSTEFGIEPQDRIDMIWYRNPRPTNSSQDPTTQPMRICHSLKQRPQVDIGDSWRLNRMKSIPETGWRENEWPSDHAAVTCQFVLDCG